MQTGLPTRLTDALRRFLTQREGTTAIEYALIAAGVAAAIIATVNAVGVSVANMWTSVSNAL